MAMNEFGDFDAEWFGRAGGHEAILEFWLGDAKDFLLKLAMAR